MNYILYGEEHYLIRKEIDRIVERSVTFEKDLNTIYFDATKTTMEEIMADAQTLPFFSEQKVVVIQRANFLSASDDTKANLDVLDAYLDNPNESTVLIMVCECEKLDGRKKAVKKWSKICKTLKFSPYSEFERNQFVLSLCEQSQVQFSKEALIEFNARVGYSPARILSEFEKVSLYSKRVAIDDVLALVRRPLDENVFDIFKSLLSHDFKRVYSYWKDFEQQGIDPIAIIAMLATQYRFLHQVKILQQDGLDKHEITRTLSANPYRVSITLDSCGQRSISHISRALYDLSQLDQDIKAGKVDKKIGLELFFIKECK